MNKLNIAMAAYAFVACMTFGHAWTSSDSRWPDMKVMGSAICAVAWPLYLSVQIWEAAE